MRLRTLLLIMDWRLRARTTWVSNRLDQRQARQHRGVVPGTGSGRGVAGRSS